MTLISSIITAALRESNTIAITTTPTTVEVAEALPRLSNIFKSLFGYEVGEGLRDLNLGDANTTLSDNSSLGWVDGHQSWWTDSTVVPANVRLVVQTTAPTTVYLSPYPEDGARFALHDPFALLSTKPVTVHGNGRLVESAASMTFNTNSIQYQWLYRADLTSWQRVEGLTDATAQMPFPDEFDDYFITELAIRLNPRYTGKLTEETLRTQTRMKKQIQSRYRQHQQVSSELGLWYPSWWGSGIFGTGRV